MIFSESDGLSMEMNFLLLSSFFVLDICVLSVMNLYNKDVTTSKPAMLLDENVYLLLKVFLDETMLLEECERVSVKN